MSTNHRPTVTVATAQYPIEAFADFTDFPPDGVLTQARDATPGWQLARLDLAGIRTLRDHGQVNNHADWSLQDDCLASGIARESLT